MSGESLDQLPPVAVGDVATTPRNLHYGHFYGLLPLPDDGRPLLIVHGNCQAEAIRVLLDGERDDADVVTVRVPPVHELTAADVPRLQALLGRVDLFVSQPVRGGYRDLPLGTAEMSRLLKRSAQALVLPIVRFAGLHPYQAIVRHPREPAAVPAVVPYHDLRIVSAAAVNARPDATVLRAHGEPAALREVGRRSLAELARRENRCDVKVSDLVLAEDATLMHTINHPGNQLLIGLARRVREAVGLTPVVRDPGRALLGTIRAPVHVAVLEALGLAPGSAPGPQHWVRDGAVIDDEAVVSGQLDWYERHPWFVGACFERHGDLLRLLDL